MSKKSTTKRKFMEGTIFAEIAALEEAMKPILKEVKRLYHKYIWREYKGARRYKSADDLINDLNDIAPYQDFYYKVRRCINFWVDLPNDAYMAIRRFIQRGKRGWSNEDTWGLHYYFARTIKESVMFLKEHKHGYPCACYPDDAKCREDGNPTAEEDEKAEAKWEQILDSIIYTFHIAELISDRDWIYTPTAKWNDPIYVNQRNSYKTNKWDIIVMDYESCKRYEEGWANFQEYFFNLWD